MIKNLARSPLLRSNLIRNQLPNVTNRTLNSKSTEHQYGVERVQYLVGKKKPKINEELDNIALLEDEDLLSVYLTKKVKRIKTSLENPIYVPSMNDDRLLCCHCDIEGLDLTYTVLKKNQVTECDCGYHFKLIDHLEPFSMHKKT